MVSRVHYPVRARHHLKGQHHPQGINGTPVPHQHPSPDGDQYSVLWWLLEWQVTLLVLFLGPSKHHYAESTKLPAVVLLCGVLVGVLRAIMQHQLLRRSTTQGHVRWARSLLHGMYSPGTDIGRPIPEPHLHCQRHVQDAVGPQMGLVRRVIVEY